MNILIVDDNLTNLKLMRTQLEGEGHIVAQAPDGVAALKLLERQPIEVVISDILMPRMDGYRLCREIRKHERLCNLPVVIYSSTFTSSDDVKLALDVGADKYLIKPASLEIILAALQGAMARPDTTPNADVLPEVDVLKEYSSRLVDKLAEKKNALDQANSKLLATGEQLARLIQHSPVVLYSLKMAGDQAIPQIISENVIRLLGFTVEEACSLEWYLSHLHPEDRDLALAGIAMVIKSGNWNGEYRIQHKAGHYLWVEDQQQLIRDAEGKPAEIVGVWTNVTERKRAEVICNLLTAIVESSFDAIIGKDLGGIVTSWNRGAERMFGYTAGEMLGQSITKLIPPDRQNDEEQILSRIRRDEVVTHFETVRLKNDGGSIEVSVTVSPIKDAAGKIVGASKVARDITDRRRVDKENQDQFRELERWHATMIGREERVLELKNEVNELLARLEQPARYSNPIAT